VQKYHPDDIKGKGEPSYSIEKALKEHKIRGDSEYNVNQRAEGAASGIEMQDRHTTAYAQQDYAEADPVEASVGRSASQAHKRHSSGLDGLKKRIGSLRKRKD
jgi:hypothetical protein